MNFNLSKLTICLLLGYSQISKAQLSTRENNPSVLKVGTRPAEGNTPALYKIKPPQIKKWFAQNVNHKSDNLIPLPIGLENHHGPSRGGSIDPNYLEGLEDINTDNICKEGKVTDKIYLNFGKTHNNRENVRNFLIESKLSFIENEKLSYANYLKKISEFLFVASPRGNGIDTHRTWEALYMGSIPIVEKHHMYDTYNLPIWQIESWDEVTNESKRNYWIERYKSGNLFQNIDQLFMDYWKNRILDEYNKL
jgi:hypothetical protein